ncbi:hypothetical protein [Mesoflavibacter sp. CH_XMU1404-2]|uniref:hypothetical protein n=1 Tax=Mesoflavibacter sp. CH_XMU1404-2 TaxID=3107766 RepID=UPI00300A41A9
MSSKESNKDFQTDWAFTDDFIKHIHISEAKSGLNGYYCLGCKKEMQAVKGQIREHYFRHHAKDVDKNNTECVVANRKYRELIARDILQRLRQLKVPAIYKYPPKNSDGAPNLLEQSKTIQAFSVKSELTFYEDEECNVRYGQNPNIEERHLLIRPDISFFNEKQEPILLVEFVVTHKIDNEKRAKLKRLGLNTVQIIIPKKNEEEIEKALKSSTKVKWVYNEVEANTNYIYTSKSSSSGVWEIDDEQSRIFEESYKCRANQISNLIRSVKRIMDSQSYKRAEHHFESEISRVERATKTERQELERLEREFESQVREEFEQRLHDFKSDESNFQRNRKDLEERYLKEKSRLESAIKIESEKFKGEDFYRDAEAELRGRIEHRRNEIDRDSRRIGYDASRVSDDIKQLPIQFEESRVQLQKAFESKDGEIRREQRDIESEIENFGDFEKEEIRELQLKHDKIKEAIIERINNKDGEGDEELSKGITSVLEIRRISDSFEERQAAYKRYKAYLEFARGGTWKKQ